MGESFGGLLALGAALEATNRPEAEGSTAAVYVCIVWMLACAWAGRQALMEIGVACYS